MFRPPTTPDSGTPAPGTATPAIAAHDTCFRCGRPTPLGVALCEHDNPGRIKAPSATQVHGTILFGVIGGFVVFGLLAALATGGVGPFPATVVGQATRADGSIEVVVSVTNDGTRPAAASCRISRRGVAGGDVVFFSDPIPVGETIQLNRIVPAGTAGSDVAVRCN